MMVQISSGGRRPDMALRCTSHRFGDATGHTATKDDIYEKKINI